MPEDPAAPQEGQGDPQKGGSIKGSDGKKSKAQVSPRKSVKLDGKKQASKAHVSPSRKTTVSDEKKQSSEVSPRKSVKLAASKAHASPSRKTTGSDEKKQSSEVSPRKSVKLAASKAHVSPSRKTTASDEKKQSSEVSPRKSVKLSANKSRVSPRKSTRLDEKKQSSEVSPRKSVKLSANKSRVSPRKSTRLDGKKHSSKAQVSPRKSNIKASKPHVSPSRKSKVKHGSKGSGRSASHQRDHSANPDETTSDDESESTLPTESDTGRSTPQAQEPADHPPAPAKYKPRQNRLSLAGAPLDAVDSLVNELADKVEKVAGADEVFEEKQKVLHDLEDKEKVEVERLSKAKSIDFGECPCGPDCTCSPPPMDEELGELDEDALEVEPMEEPAPNFNLNDFSRAKEFFMTASTKTGISLYDHFSELIRKLLDNRAPTNPVDFVEELSLNLKRYRFGMAKDVIQDAYYLSDTMVKESTTKIKNWKKHALWSLEKQEQEGDSDTFGGFPNLLRLQYYLEQINIGLPREEMFKVALQLRQISMQNSVSRVRFWGKIFGIQGNYYIFESELAEGQTLDNVWAPTVDELANPEFFNEMEFEEEEASILVPGAAATFDRAGGAVMDPDVLNAYLQSAGKVTGKDAIAAKLTEYPGEGAPPLTEEDAQESAKWKEYRDELTADFPKPLIEPVYDVPSEESGHGVNRRVFFVWSEKLGRAFAFKSYNEWNEPVEDVKPNDDESVSIIHTVTPAQINGSRQIRWYLSGDLNAEIRSYPPFPGREGNYLRALLARITAGTAVSPKGYYKTKKPAEGDEDEEEEEEEEEVEEEEEETIKEDIVYPVKKFRPTNIRDLANPQVDLWVHHASHILRQGRTAWFNMEKLKEKKGDDEEEVDEEEDVEEEEEEEEPGAKDKEIGPNLFSELEQDSSLDGTKPWSARTSSSVFTEFEVVSVRSNLWPGANAMCTIKGKVENIYLGDGLKFQGHSYAPFLPDEPQREYKDGPELTEIADPTVQAEQEWLAKLQLGEIADVEDKFVDNEEEGEGEEEDEDDDDD